MKEAAITADANAASSKRLLLLPLLMIAPLGYFVSSYLEGMGVLPTFWGFAISAFSMFLLPFFLSVLFFLVGLKEKWSAGLLLFIVTLVAQWILVFLVPPAAKAELMGFAHKLRRDFSPHELGEVASQIRQKYRDGTLIQKSINGNDGIWMSKSAIVVDEEVLPVSLKGRFVSVFILPDEADVELTVFFATGTKTGIVCDNRKHVDKFFFYPLADGVYAYHYQRP